MTNLLPFAPLIGYALVGIGYVLITSCLVMPPKPKQPQWVVRHTDRLFYGSTISFLISIWWL
jgi:hypothetical protein